MTTAFGVNDFKEIIQFRSSSGERAKYFDKTLMLKDIVDDASKCLLFTRPRRFGKSLNMSMLKYFFGTEEDLFSGLKISQYQHIIEKYRGKIPTISFSLKGVDGSNFESLLHRLSYVIKSTYEDHKLVLDNTSSKWLNQDCFSEDDITISILELSKKLYNHYNSPVLILVDEYDVPLNTAYVEGYLDKAIKLIRSFFSQTFKDNPSLFKGILTGINHIAKESIFSELNNFITHDIDSKNYAIYYGFTEEEIESLDLPEKNKAEIKEWYNGYNFGGNIIYNPWSVLNYISTASNYRADNYWSNSGGISLIEDTISISKAEDLQILLDGGEILIEIENGLIYKRLKTDKNAFYNLLYNAGYLTAIDNWQAENRRKLRIVNKEINNLLGILIRDWFCNQKDTFYTITKLFESFILGSPEDIEDILNETAIQSFSFHDITKKNRETFYHGFLLGIGLCAKERYSIKSNRESGYGRYDIAWYPKNIEKDPGILIELKVDSSSAKKALAQIDTRKYEADLVQYGCKKIISYGIHANGKKIKVAMNK
jgi:hypothetical protein